MNTYAAKNKKANASKFWVNDINFFGPLYSIQNAISIIYNVQEKPKNYRFWN